MMVNFICKVRSRFESRAFTLVETTLAVALLCVVMVVAWQLFRTSALSAAKTAWHTKCQQQLRNGLRLLRDDLAKASYPSVVGPTSVTVSKAGKGFRYKKGKLTLTEAGGETPLMGFYICKPKKTGFGGPDDAPGDTIHATLTAKGNTIVYRKEGATDPNHNLDKVVFDEVDFVNLDGPDSMPAERSTTILLEVKTIHKIWLQSGVLERTNPKIEVEVSSGL
jgi:hypothetical protein